MNRCQTVYRLVHKRLQTYVAWPHGRQKIVLASDSDLMRWHLLTMLRLENLAWGGNDDVPVIEMHAILGNGRVFRTDITARSITAWISHLRRRQRSLISATATPGGTDASQTIRKSTT